MEGVEGVVVEMLPEWGWVGGDRKCGGRVGRCWWRGVGVGGGVCRGVMFAEVGEMLGKVGEDVSREVGEGRMGPVGGECGTYDGGIGVDLRWRWSGGGSAVEMKEICGGGGGGRSAV